MPSNHKSPTKLRGSSNNMSRAKLSDVINFFRLAVFVSAAGILYHSVMHPPACDISINLSSPHEFDQPVVPPRSRNAAVAASQGTKDVVQRQAQQQQQQPQPPNQKTEAPTDGNSEEPPARKTFTPCPEEFRNLVWFRAGPDTKLYEPLHRAFHSRGYSVTRDKTRAHYLWTDQPWHVGSMHNTLKPWQRYNHLYNTRAWDDKDRMADHMNEYYHSGDVKPLHSFPEAHVLHRTKGRKEFLERLSEEHGGMDEPWVLKKPIVNRGEGVTILPPRSDKLLELEETLQRGKPEERLVVQKYICDEMTYAGRKFDVRVFWTVSSVDPLIVWYHTEQNYVRVGHAAYDESTLKNSTTKSILTTHTFMAAEIKGTWDEFRESIENHVYSKDSRFRERFAIDGSEPEGVRKTLEAIHKDPFGHVQNQMKTVIGHLVNAFRKKVFHPNAMKMENGFTWHAADMIIDNNLDVFIIEGTDGPGKDEDYDFRIKMHSELFGSMLDLAQEVTAKQEAGLPVNVTEMEEKGINGGYEIVYNDGWYMDYRFDRLPQKGCLYGGSGEANTKKKKKGRLPSREVLPATYTALPKDQSDFKTFWIKERTKQWNEPIARALRHTGWTPVDTPGEAQVVYQTREEFPQYEDFARPWQLVSQFPSQYSFFDGIAQAYNDKVVTEKTVKTACCRALKQGNGPIRVVAYWLVLSLDPLTVLYHDGYLHQMYNPKDENEFVDLTADGRTEKVWKGSWRAFDHYLREAHAKLDASGKNPAATAAAALSVDPMTHVRSQMKASMVKLAEGFAAYAREEAQNEESGDPTFSSYALFMADFRVDEDLNVFAKDASHNMIKGEDHAEVVAMHDDLYGSAFRLMRHINTTSTTEEQYNEDTLAKLKGDYEWVIRPNAEDPKHGEPWKFTYDWKHKAQACKPTRFLPYHAAVDTTDEEHDEEHHDVDVTAATA